MFRTSHLVLILILGAALFPSCQPTSRHSTEATADAPLPMIGLWKLHIMERFDTSTGEWSAYRNGMQGYLLYDAEGHMALHLSTRGYEQFRPEFPNFTEQIQLAALQHLTNSYHYLGTYTVDVDSQIVTHTKLAHSNPKEWGLEARRAYDFEGDTLVITPTERANANLRLKWIPHRH